MPEAASTRNRPRIVLADDHPGLLVEIDRRLALEFNVLRSVTDGAALVEAAAELKPDAVVADISMPYLTGIEACSQILREGYAKNAVLLSMYDDPELVRSALDAGILGYVLKLDAGEELASAVRMVLIGRRYLSRRVLKKWNQRSGEES